MVDDELNTLMTSFTALSPAVSIPFYMSQGPESPASADYPFIVCERVSAPSEQSIDGAISYTPARYSFDCSSLKRREARQVADALISYLQGHEGTEIKGIEHETDYGMYDADTKSYHIVADFMISF